MEAFQPRDVRDPSRVLEQGPDRQRAPDKCSGGVSSISGASESRCPHDHSAKPKGNHPYRRRNGSSPAAIRLHEGRFTSEAEKGPGFRSATSAPMKSQSLQPGQALIEMVNKVHRGVSLGPEPAVVVVVYVAPKGIPTRRRKISSPCGR